MKYKLNFARDVDTDEPDVLILNLPSGFCFDDNAPENNKSHVKAYDTLKELRSDIKFNVINCNCISCNK